MPKQEKIVLEQRSLTNSTTYKVLEMVNRADLQIGQYLKQKQVDDLLTEQNLTVVVKGVKR